MKRIYIILFVLLFIVGSTSLMAQQVRVFPSNWWVGMKWNNVQILLYNKSENFVAANIKLKYPGVVVKKVTVLENPHYASIDVTIATNTKPGNVIIKYNNKEGINWPILQRRAGNGKQFAQGVTSNDLVYLLMPDRFSNGDTTNDKIAGLLDQSLNRDSMYLRHGGDLQGVINKLDYLKDLGVTTVWMTPILLNDMPSRTEHGYAITDHYTVDPRLGGNSAYLKLSAAIHAKGMKLIQDAVYNHVGIKHITVIDPPMKSWLHQWPQYTQTTYREQVLFDAYAAASETKKLSDGWFVPSMPDLNQSNPYVANFLIQHALWSVENFGIDGWRIDTYIYNDLAFMNTCNKALLADFPSITMFGETWVHGVVNQSYFCENNMNTKFKSNLQNTTDFQQLFYGIQAALNEKQGWTEGVSKLYNTTAQDILYKNPMGQVIFLDNHDLSRFFSVINEDVAKYKMALGWLLTFRGIPQLYYGNEILMKGFSNPDGLVRSDFLGGWKQDSINKFTTTGRTAQEDSVFQLIKTLANFRLTSSAIRTGKLMQYLPDDGLYTYFRYNQNEKIICMLNTSTTNKTIDISVKYPDMVKAQNSVKNIFTNEISSTKINIPAQTFYIGKLL
ncbi:alpha-amylase family glycosyl hydrolase [Ferruginibacter yonginensis]|uniref:Alpha-amylase family glycosyl hydrolase n=1 Tax=Ferruginibacter yonginensis TaxID=1310416 RepID=A0ABV8QQQ2_9BACT